MSEFIVKSPKHCAKQGGGRGGLNAKRLINKKLVYAVSTFVISLGFLVLLVYLLLHPSKPEFYLREANLYQLNLLPAGSAAEGGGGGPSSSSGGHLLNTSVQITLISKNPNQKVGVYYDQLQLYASYKGQQITAEASLPPFYQGHQDKNILTALLNGSELPVASSFGYEVSRDQTAGSLVLSLKANGQLRWKVGTWVSTRYRLNVECVVVMAFPNSAAAPLSSNQVTRCSTAL